MIGQLFSSILLWTIKAGRTDIGAFLLLGSVIVGFQTRYRLLLGWI